ncbi:hypothetical protein A0J61_02558 [Choanephora cucurbitarum]|uniref:Major facilitator superfamily (MFS) profile domain-containing protein n=1 Tax=Choanephora cucurbitarum TaxID=101091 RepID=A0A1C7NJS7_9FUNG|nr:hypothetical protein A0J61_02558 [Choanephora cucurbitarum]
MATSVTKSNSSLSMLSADQPMDEQTFQVTEKRLVRKLDLRLIPWLSVLYLMLSLDRNNIGNARLGSLEKDLNLVGNEYYTALTIFFAVVKRFSPSRWMAGTMVLWGICSLCQAFTHNAAGLIVCRFFLGCFEVGVGPSTPLYLSFWYQRKELATRVAIYFGSSTIAGAFAGAIAYGVLSNLDGAHGVAGWRWLFIVEAIPTIVLGIMSFIVLPDLPETANRWLTAEEKRVALQRTRQSGNTDAVFFDKQQFFAALMDYKVWLAVIIYVGLNIALSSFAIFLPTIIRDMGFSSLHAQLLSIPPYVVACCLLVSWNSDRTLQRGYHIIGVCSLGILGYIFLLATDQIGVRYTGAILVACGIYPIIPLTLSWVSNNQLGHTKRGVAIAMTSMIAQCFSMLGTQIYRTEDGPRYIKGHVICLIFLGLAACSAGLLRFLLARENTRRNKEFGAPSEDMTHIDFIGLYDRHPSFRYTL